ncbi:MAG: xanthine dehydrogenase family protein [Vallitaleaceae bacterium]|nr:xanthine dehydrogenase family protein [Vallitaleaceae bacterium]
MNDISRSVNKVDNEEKIKGSAKYIDDLVFEGMLYAKTVRSTIVKGRIVSRNYPDLPEGYFIVDAKDIPGENYVKMIFQDMPVFADEMVNYYGEPIALVIGADKSIILELLAAIRIEYEEMEPVYELQNSAISYHYDKGEPKRAFAEAHQIIASEYETGYQEHVYIEPQGVIGQYEAGRVVLLGSMQCPYYIKNALIQILACKEDGVRVIQTTTGGAFGGKEEFPSLIACQVAVAVTKIKKTIKLIYEREEDMAYTTKRHPSKTRLEAAIGEDKEIKGLRAYVALDGGAYIGLSGVVLQRAMIASTGAYTINHLEVFGEVFVTNTVPTGAFRGFGAPQMVFAVEMFIHHIAQKLNLDPLELRKKYLAREGDLTSTGGTFRDPIIMPKMIDKAMAMSSYEDKIQAFKENNAMKSPKSYKGIGMSWFLHGCGFTGSGEQEHIKGVVRLRKEISGDVTILAAATDMGQGIKTTMRKIVAQVLEKPLKTIHFDNPDTDFVPDSGPTVASRTIMVVGGLVARAAKSLKERWDEANSFEVEMKYKQPDYLEWNQEKLNGDAYPAYSWGVNVVEVEVHPLTYQVTLKGSWSVYDVGKAIDERIIIGQAEGGLLQAIGYGMLEVMDQKKGRIRQRTVTDYMIPTASDSVNMETVLMDNPFPLGPYGAKGAGELTLIGGAPAVALAIENAIQKVVTKIPVTPETIMELMNDGRN